MNKNRKFKFDDHFFGRLFLGLGILIIVAIPIIMCLILKTLPNFEAIGKAMIPLVVFIAGGFVEVITYSPMLGVSGTYLGFFTGNLVNLKVPCAVNAREQANVKHGSKEGEVISCLSISVSTLLTTVILAIGVACIVPLTPVLENPILVPAFHSAFTALFGALAYKYFIKDLKLVPIPLILSFVISFFLKESTGTSVPICAVASVIVAVVIFKIQNKKVK